MPTSDVDEVNEIVVVDDSPSNLAILSRVLNDAGYEMHAFRNSVLALKSIHARPPAVILLDAQMPDMDGYEVCRRLKADERTRDIPVIFISAMEDEQAKLAGFQAGGVDYISKPFSEAEVLVRVNPHMKLRQTQRALARQNAALAAAREQLEELVATRTAELAAANVQLRREIAEHQQTEAALRESELILRQLKKAIETTGLGITITDAMGKIIYTNPADAQMHGYAVNELIGQPAHIFASPEYRRPLRQVNSDEPVFQDWRRERPNMRRDGTVFPAKLTSNPIYDTHKFRIGTVTVCEDISEQKLMEQALRDSEERFRLIAETIQEVFWISDNETRRTFYVSPSYEEVWQRSRQSLYENPQSFIDAIHPEDRDRVVATLEVKKAGQPFEHEYRILLPDGSIRWIFDRGFPVREASGEILRYVGAARDITARKLAEIALHESEERLRNIVQNMPILCDAFDQNGVALFWNKECERVTGYTADEIVNNPNALELLAPDPEYRTRVIEQLNSLGHQYRDWELEIRRKDGEHRVIAWSNISRDCPLPGWWSWGVGVDVTARKRAEAERQRANEQLRELNASKDKFFSIIAHDLKNSLNAFLSFADLLDRLDEYDEEKRLALFAQFRTTAEHLFALLDNLLTWARSQQGHIPYEPYRFTLAAVVAQALQLVRPNAAAKRIQLVNMIPRELSVFADLDMLEAVIRNLLTNAIKFTPLDGSVTITAQANDATIEISVSDTGIGITPEKAATLFELGVKTKHTGTAGEKGTGLGLILCKEFITRHGGTIGCESVVGLGSVFRIMLPK